MALQANAEPAKRFFIELITRDITLEDSLLDLIDNSIDSLIRVKAIDISANILLPSSRPVDTSKLPAIDVFVAEDEISVVDRSGGISIKRAQNEVFHFGKQEPSHTGTLGVYGIGLKRAIFKLGEHVEITSQTATDGFVINLDVPKWKHDADNWKIPMKRQPPATSAAKAGTVVKVGKLYPDIQMRVQDPTLAAKLTDIIGTTYCLFIGRYVQIRLNGSDVAARSIPIGSSEEVPPSKAEFDHGPVHVTIHAGLASRVNGQWNIDRAGWYVLCNGRVVVSADKSELTGWAKPNPQFVSKYRGFVGIVFFFSHDPDALPWTTTKRGMNVESVAYQLARRHMVEAARPVTAFLNRMYQGDEQESVLEREMSNDVVAVDLRTLTSAPLSRFEPKPSASRTIKSTIQVQYPAEAGEIDRARRALRKPNWSASKIGRHALDYLLEREAPK